MDIVCIGAAEWHGIWARAQQLMVRLAERGHRILYVDPPITYLAPLKNPALWKTRFHEPKSLVEVSADNIWLMKPPIFFPFHGMKRSVNRLNQRMLASALKKRLRVLGWDQPVLWTYLPGSCDLLDSKLNWRTVVYDCVDDHAAFTGLINPSVMQRMEDELAKKADVVFASAKALADKMKKVQSDVSLVPNAADVEHFGQALNSAPQNMAIENVSSKDTPSNDISPKDAPLKDMPSKGLSRGYTHIVGFVGGIGDWIDTDLLAELARSKPDWALVLIGPVDTDATQLKSLPNVYLLGRKPYAELPAYVQRFDVCLSPFRLNELTVSVNPVKVYEYLAAGKPVVSTALPEVMAFSPVVSVAGDSREFISMVEEALQTDSAEKVAQRVALAKENSWDARLDAMVEVISNRSL